MVTTGQVVKELIARSLSGVFALRNKNGKVKVQYKRSAPWSMTLGLASRLQTAIADDVMLNRRYPDRTKLIAGCDPLDSTNLELATMDALLAELYRKEDRPWVLGLSRPMRIQGEWTALCCSGDRVVCAGLASILVGAIEHEDYAPQLRDKPPLEKLAELFGAVLCHVDTESSLSLTWMAGITRMAEDVIGNLPAPIATPVDDLRKFVSID